MAKPQRNLLGLSAIALRDELAAGSVQAAELTEACIEQIAAREAEVNAWCWHDPAHAREQAALLDRQRSLGLPLGPLHGLPVGIKDVIDTARIPTENGTSVDAGRVPSKDAYVVERLKSAGAVIMGKTVTAELAYLHPGKTRNPHNTACTPGGSSQGSAAAVAAGMVPLAIGTQTGGSVIRPASFCGVTGFKPTFGAVPRRGVLTQSPSLDTVGVFARTAVDAALIAEVLFGVDEADPATRLQPHPRLLETAGADAPLPPVFALVHPPGWDDADPEVHEAFAELAEALGDQCFEVQLPSVFNQAVGVREDINLAEMARCYYRYGRDGGEVLSRTMRAALSSGEKILARDYLSALDVPKLLNAALEEILARCDCILCPAAPGPAPESLDTTGDSVFNGLWTLTGSPAVTVPLLTSSKNLPMGVQLVGEHGNDGRLLRCAHWLTRWAASA